MSHYLLPFEVFGFMKQSNYLLYGENIFMSAVILLFTFKFHMPADEENNKVKHNNKKPVQEHLCGIATYRISVYVCDIV